MIKTLIILFSFSLSALAADKIYYTKVRYEENKKCHYTYYSEIGVGEVLVSVNCF